MHNNKLVFRQHLGGTSLPSVNQTGSWLQWLIPFCYQRCQGGVEDDGCTNFSLRDDLQILGSFQGEIPDISVSYNYKDSGTIPGEGNSYEAPVEALMAHWTCPEADRPFTPLVTTLQELIAPITAQQNQDALTLFNQWEIQEQQIATDLASLKQGLTVSPVRVGMCGEYEYDQWGRIQMNSNPVYNHVNVIVGIRQSDGAFIMFDSEAEAIEYVAPNYVFQTGFVYSLKKKPMFYKIAGNSALFSVSPTSGKLVPYQDGDVYKLVNQTATYSNIKTYPTLAALMADFQFDDWQAAKEPWDSQTFINSFSQ